MKLLFAIPHYCSRVGTPVEKYGSRNLGPVERGAALARCVVSLHQTFGTSQAIIQVGDRKTIPANQSMSHQVRVLIVTTGDSHAVAESQLPTDLFDQIDVDVPPMELGFACHRALAEQGHDSDYCCYLEDDLVITDPWWFAKLAWFNRHLDQDNLLIPNRYELSTALAYKKCYLDGDLAPHVVTPFQNVADMPELSSKMLGKPIRFVRPLNPHSGCFFLNQHQRDVWTSQPTFGVASSDFIGPLESAANVSIMQAFQLYKPAAENASFLELEHHGCQFIRKIRKL